jgi:hypothetical protein
LLFSVHGEYGNRYLLLPCAGALPASDAHRSESNAAPVVEIEMEDRETLETTERTAMPMKYFRLERDPHPEPDRGHF